MASSINTADDFAGNVPTFAGITFDSAWPPAVTTAAAEFEALGFNLDPGLFTKDLTPVKAAMDPAVKVFDYITSVDNASGVVTVELYFSSAIQAELGALGYAAFDVEVNFDSSALTLSATNPVTAVSGMSGVPNTTTPGIMIFGAYSSDTTALTDYVSPILTLKFDPADSDVASYNFELKGLGIGTSTYADESITLDTTLTTLQTNDPWTGQEDAILSSLSGSGVVASEPSAGEYTVADDNYVMTVTTANDIQIYLNEGNAASPVVGELLAEQNSTAAVSQSELEVAFPSIADLEGGIAWPRDAADESILDALLAASPVADGIVDSATGGKQGTITHSAGGYTLTIAVTDGEATRFDVTDDADGSAVAYKLLGTAEPLDDLYGTSAGDNLAQQHIFSELVAATPVSNLDDKGAGDITHSYTYDGTTYTLKLTVDEGTNGGASVVTGLLVNDGSSDVATATLSSPISFDDFYLATSHNILDTITDTQLIETLEGMLAQATSTQSTTATGTEDITVFGDLRDADLLLQTPLPEGEDGTTWSVDGTAILTALLDDTSATVEALTHNGSPAGVVISNSTHRLEIRETDDDTDAAGTLGEITVLLASGPPIAQADASQGHPITKTLGDIVAAFPQLDVVSASGSGGGVDLATVKLFVEQGSSTFDGETHSFTYVYNDSWELVAGEETRGATTIEYGPNWQENGSTTDVQAGGFALADLTNLPEAFINEIFPDGSVEFNSTTDGTTGEVTKVASFIQTTAGTNDIPVYTETNNWEWGGSETTYFDATGKILGYVNRNEWTDDYADPAAPGGATGGTSAGTVSYNVSYQDADWNWIGNEWDDQWGSGSTFNVEVEVGDLASTHPIKVASAAGGYLDGSEYTDNVKDIIRVESGSSQWQGSDNTTESREWTYYFGVKSDGSMGDFLGGEETFDGTTTQYGLNWESLGEKVDISNTSAFTVVTPTDLADLPDAFANATLSNSESKHGGTETTYFDSTGNIVGKAREYVEGVNSNTNYEDANGTWLGSTYENEYGSGYSFTSSSNVNPLTLATGTFTIEEGKGFDTLGNEENSWTFVFDEGNNGQFVAGEETHHGVTKIYGPNWQVVSEVVAGLDSLPILDPAVAADLTEINKLPEALKVYASNGDLAAIKISTKTYPEGTETTYIAPDGSILGYSNSYTWPADEYGSGGAGVSYSDANYDWLGYYNVNDDGSSSSLVVEDRLDSGGSVIGTKQTSSESTEVGGVVIYSSTKIEEYDASHPPVLVGVTETVTSVDAASGLSSTVVTKYDSNYNIIGSFDGNGKILDPLAVFQIGSFVFETDVVKDYATSEGVNLFYDGDSNGTPDVLEEDLDANGIADWNQYYAVDILHDAILSPDFKPEPIIDAGNGTVIGFQTATANYFVELFGSLTVVNDSPTAGSIDTIKVYKSDDTVTTGYQDEDGNYYAAGNLIATADNLDIPIVDLIAYIDAANPQTGGGGNTTPTTPDLTAFDELVDEDLNNSASEDADGITWSTVGHTILEGLLVAPVGGAAPTPVALTSPNGVSVTDDTYTLTILESSTTAGAIDSITVYQKIAGTDTVIASVDTVTQTMADLVTAFPQLDVVSSGPDLTAFDELVDEDLNNSASEDADGITWSTVGHTILEGLLVAPVGGAAPTPVALTSPNGVSVTDDTYTLTILESSTTAGAIDSITVYQKIAGTDTVIASVDTVTQTMADLVTAFPQLDVVSSGPDLTAFDELVDEDLNNSASEDADGITWSTDGHTILEGLLVAPVGGAAPTPVALTSPNGVSVTDDTYTLTILESSTTAGAIDSITVYQKIAGTDTVIASVDHGYTDNG